MNCCVSAKVDTWVRGREDKKLCLEKRLDSTGNKKVIFPNIRIIIFNPNT